MSEHFATIEVSEGADGSFQAEIYFASDPGNVIEGFGLTKEEAVADAMRAWIGSRR